MEQLTLLQKSELRVKALMVSKDINHVPPSYGTTGLQGYNKLSATAILKDAQIIYKWLSEGENDWDKPATMQTSLTGSI